MEIFVRHAEVSDAEAVHRIYSGSRVIWGTLQLPYASVETYRKRIADTLDGHYNLVALVGGELVGQISLNTYPGKARRSHAAYVGMSVRDDWQGKGIGSALLREALVLADHWLNLKRVALDVFVDNAPAIALYEKFGFEREGLQRAYAFRDGAFVDTLLMARVR
jgi:L-phenylalanine/L-methionine N-acetyltransferase